MLSLTDVTKTYTSGNQDVRALKGVSMSFRKSEFVSVLGPSGCGKTTLLNIIGGLDRYTSGDLVINGVSTKDYKDGDWDAYRNHSVGFVFQSYNLIPHQTVIKNVELALTLSGIGKEERRRRAKEALEKVGLSDQLNKRPNQLSGGQMQRVAIARAIVNDPEIILADEPTGALDSETSVQIMEILKELSSTRLIVMVTHNGELAREYSTRIISLSDGLVIGDTNPYNEEPEAAVVEEVSPEQKPKKNGKKQKKPSMSFLTALSLSLNNLFTKKARTILTAFAGSIGIIGIALILSLSAGFNSYIADVQRDTLSNYPVTINRVSVDTTSLVSNFLGRGDEDAEEYPDEQTITSRNMIENLLTGVISSVKVNDLVSFKKHLDDNFDKELVSAIKYTYNVNKYIYYETEVGGARTNRQLLPIVLPDPSTVVPGALSGLNDYYDQFKEYMDSRSVFGEMIDNQRLLNEQYDVLHGSWPTNDHQAVLVVDEHNQISDVDLYMMGLMDESDITYMFTKLLYRSIYANSANPPSEERLDEMVTEFLGYSRHPFSYSFEDMMGLKYKIVLSAETYKKASVENGVQLWEQKNDDDIQQYLNEGNYHELTISGIVRKKSTATAGSLNNVICYTKALTERLIARNNDLDLVKQFAAEEVAEVYHDFTAEGGGAEINYNQHVTQMTTFGANAIDLAAPESIVMYFVNFESKDVFAKFVDDYNAQFGEGEEGKQIKYTDYVGMLMSSVTTIINAITYVLIAFVSISLIVSSIMIAVITHISVLERTKEIGVLRSIGASKRDVSRVFNAETFIIGLVSGVMGILLTLLLIIPINIIIASLAELYNIAALPVWGAFSLIAISVVLTVIAGLIPASTASKKDPVVALRSE